MATIEEALYDGITGYSRISDLIDNRLYPLIMPQNPTYPAVVYSRVSERGLLMHDGPPPGGSDVRQGRFQFDIYGDTYASVQDVAGELRAYLHGFVGEMGGVQISVIIHLNTIDGLGEEVEIFRTTQDYRIIHYI